MYQKQGQGDMGQDGANANGIDLQIEGEDML